MLNNISYKGTVTGNYYVGGLVGALLFKNISDSEVNATVTTSSYGAGGLVGYLHYSNISNSSATGLNINNNYALGEVYADHYAGGLIGYADGYYTLAVTNNYAAALVKGVI